MFIYFWERGRDNACGEGQRVRETQNLKYAPGFELSAQSQTWGSNLRTMRSWIELKSDTESTEPFRCPIVSSLELTWMAAFIFSSNLLLLNVELEGTFPYPTPFQSLHPWIDAFQTARVGEAWQCSFSVLGSNECYHFQGLEFLFKSSPVSSDGGKEVLIIQIQPSSKCQILRFLKRENIFCWGWNPSFPLAWAPCSCWVFLHNRAHLMGKWNSQIIQKLYFSYYHIIKTSSPTILCFLLLMTEIFKHTHKQRKS